MSCSFELSFYHGCARAPSYLARRPLPRKVFIGSFQIFSARGTGVVCIFTIIRMFSVCRLLNFLPLQQPCEVGQSHLFQIQPEHTLARGFLL